MIRRFQTYLKSNLCYISRINCSSKAPRPILSINKKMFKSSVFNLQEATSEQVQEFLNSFDTVLSDCDGM